MYIHLFTVQCPDSLLHRSTLVLFLCDCVFSSFTHFLQLSMDSKETVRTSNVMLSPFRSFSQFLHNPGQFTGKPIWASTLEATSQLRSSWEGFQKKTGHFVFSYKYPGQTFGKNNNKQRLAGLLSTVLLKDSSSGGCWAPSSLFTSPPCSSSSSRTWPTTSSPSSSRPSSRLTWRCCSSWRRCSSPSPRIFPRRLTSRWWMCGWSSIWWSHSLRWQI